MQGASYCNGRGSPAVFRQLLLDAHDLSTHTRRRTPRSQTCWQPSCNRCGYWLVTVGESSAPYITNHHSRVPLVLVRPNPISFQYLIPNSSHSLSSCFSPPISHHHSIAIEFLSRIAIPQHLHSSTFDGAPSLAFALTDSALTKDRSHPPR